MLNLALLYALPAAIATVGIAWLLADTVAQRRGNATPVAAVLRADTERKPR